MYGRIMGREQPDMMAEWLELSCPVMSRPASLEDDGCRRA